MKLKYNKINKIIDDGHHVLFSCVEEKHKTYQALKKYYQKNYSDVTDGYKIGDIVIIQDIIEACPRYLFTKKLCHYLLKHNPMNFNILLKKAEYLQYVKFIDIVKLYHYALKLIVTGNLKYRYDFRCLLSDNFDDVIDVYDVDNYDVDNYYDHIYTMKELNCSIDTIKQLEKPSILRHVRTDKFIHKLLLKHLESDGTKVRYIDDYFLTKSFIRKLFNKCPSSIDWLHSKYLSENFLLNLVNKHWDVLKYIPDHLLTEKLLLKLVEKNWSMIEYIPEKLLTDKLRVLKDNSMPFK